MVDLCRHCKLSIGALLRNSRKEIIVIGGNDAGLAAAGRAHRLAKQLPVVVLEKSDYVAFASCGLPYYLGQQLTEKDIAGPGAEKLQAKRGFEVRTGQDVMAIDSQKHLVLVRNVKSNSVHEQSFSKLIIATGAAAKAPEDLKQSLNVYTLRHISDAVKIDAFIRQQTVKRIVIVGAGYLGLELADVLSGRGLSVALLEKDILPAHLPETFFPRLKKELESKGVQWHGAAGSIAWQKDGKNIRAFRMTPDSAWDNVDMVLIAAGIQPASELALKAGLRIEANHTIHVNAYQQTSRPDIYAVGDCCSTKNLVSKKLDWLPLAGIAARQGRVAGENAAGGSVQFPGALGTQMVQCFGMELGRTGLTLQQAVSLGFVARETIIQQSSHSEYMPQNSPIDMQVIWDAKSKRLLGGTVTGSKGAGYYLNMLAIALQAEMTIKDLAYLDLGYTPPINHMMNPLHIAASVALKSK
jgi:NADPH-dependent 2,4-dienoyl-CoA reductase/sulfur reductase-like enzyme